MSVRVPFLAALGTFVATAALGALGPEPGPEALTGSPYVPVHSAAASEDLGPEFAIENDSGVELRVRWTGQGVSSEPFVAPAEDLLALPEAVERVEFSDSRGHRWRYSFDAARVDWRALRPYGFRRDSLDPYLYFLRITPSRRLEIVGSHTRIVGLPAEPSWD